MSIKLNIGVLGCGAIAQAAHFESCVKARNATLYSVCDVAEDLCLRMQSIHGAKRAFHDFDEMLADPALDAVIIATSDVLHVPLSIRALQAGKHVLCEKPMATNVQEAELLASTVISTGKIFQIGHMKRYDAGLQAAKQFITSEMGDILALKAWYCDSSHRYTMTDAVQPKIITSKAAWSPTENPKADLKRYFMLAHGSHLVDTARYFGGEIKAVNARLRNTSGIHCWFVDVEFENGTLGHLDLTIAVRMDWYEGFQIYGQNGSVIGKTYNPWYFKSSDVEIFREKEASYIRPLAADGHFFRRQVEGFAEACFGGPQTGSDAHDGLASVKTMVAISRSAKEGVPISLENLSGGF